MNKSPVFGKPFSTYLMRAFSVARSLPDTGDEVGNVTGGQYRILPTFCPLLV